jgi:hypothetical protein
MAGRRSLNYKVLLILSPLLILTGALGFVFPPGTIPLSSEPAYNLFHIAFGIIGLLLLIFRYENPIRVFNIVFGLIGIYQAIASYNQMFPQEYFKWTRVDDGLHIVFGTALALIGLYGFISSRKRWQAYFSNKNIKTADKF